MPPVSASGLDQVLRERGLRATPQRRLVLQAVSELGHATPEQVCEYVQGQTASLNLSTVYRALELLEELGVVSHTHLQHGSPTYQVADHVDHLHLVCRGCGPSDRYPGRPPRNITPPRQRSMSRNRLSGQSDHCGN